MINEHEALGLSLSAFVFGDRPMEKTDKNKEKDARRKGMRKWVDVPTKIENRKCGSGITFGGEYRILGKRC